MDTRESLVAALIVAGKEAGRMQQRDHLSRPNIEWAEKHAEINSLLDRLARVRVRVPA